jgi:hypothetical protein
VGAKFPIANPTYDPAKPNGRAVPATVNKKRIR